MPDHPRRHAKKKKTLSGIFNLKSKQVRDHAKQPTTAASVKTKTQAGLSKRVKRVAKRAVLLTRAIAIYLYRKVRGSVKQTKTVEKWKVTRRRLVLYAGTGVMVVIAVLLVMFVPGKAAVPADAELADAEKTATNIPVLAINTVNAIPTTEPDLSPVPTTRPDDTVTLTPKPTDSPKPSKTPVPSDKPKETPKASTKPTATPKPTTKPTSTPKPTQKPTSTPKPTQKPTPTPDTRPTTDMEKILDYYVTSEGPYYNEVGYNSNHYDYTQDELMIMARIIQDEAGGESTNGKIAVGNVIINRVLCGRFGKSIDAVKGDFAYNADTVPRQASIDAARTVLDKEVWKVPQNTYYFKTSGGSWRTFKLFGSIGNHYFYTADYSGRHNGSGIPPALYDRTYKYAQYGCKPEGRVTRIQKMLKSLGYDTGTDGYFGLTTKSALVQFQKDNGLDADGVAGRGTVEALIKKYGVDKYISDYLS